MIASASYEKSVATLQYLLQLRALKFRRQKALAANAAILKYGHFLGTHAFSITVFLVVTYRMYALGSTTPFGVAGSNLHQLASDKAM